MTWEAVNGAVIALAVLIIVAVAFLPLVALLDRIERRTGGNPWDDLDEYGWRSDLRHGERGE